MNKILFQISTHMVTMQKRILILFSLIFLICRQNHVGLIAWRVIDGNNRCWILSSKEFEDIHPEEVRVIEVAAETSDIDLVVISSGLLCCIIISSYW